MSRKQKLAEEHAKSEGDNGNAETSFLAGYAACEQETDELVDTLEKILVKPLGWSDADYKHISNLIAKWKERGE